MLRFHLLGPFEAWLGREPIPAPAWRTRQTLAVLKLLLTERGRVVTFERLGDLVWPESDPSAARASLRVAVRTIRSVLDPEVAGSAARHPATAPGGYRYDPSGCWVDVDGFLNDCRSGAAAERRGDRQAALRAYSEAAGAYRGDFLADDPYLDWALEERERLRSACLDGLERLAALLSEDGAHAEAAGHLERALSLDPLREELYSRLMKVHSAAGRRSHALAAYERCRRVLERELGATPSRETDRVRDEIAGSAAGPAAAAPIALDLAFVGRELELETMAGEWLAARSEPGRAVLVRGAVGVGKTRLVRRFSERGEPPPRTLWLTGHEAEVELALAPVLSLVGAWLENSASGGQVARLGAAAPALAHVLPAVRTVWPGTPPLTTPPDSSQLLEALTLALLQIQGTGPALLVFDDLHWIDSATAAWLGYALRRLPAGVLLVATIRDGEPLPAAVQALIADRRREARLTELTLDPLSSAEVKRLVPDTPDLAGRLHEATSGNPLFLVEILRELDRRGAPGKAELPLPPSVREAIRTRIRLLGKGAREALAVICVHGAACSASLVSEAIGESLDATLTELDTLLERRLLTPTEDGRAYTVEHPLVGRVVVDDLSPGRRQLWHMRLAAALRRPELAHPGASAQVLRHLKAGEGIAEEVIEVGLAAGDQAMARHAYAEALECFRISRDRLAEIGDSDRHAIAMERPAEALSVLGRWDEAIACYEQLLGDTTVPLRRSRLRRRMAQALADYGARGLNRALELLAEAEKDVGDAEPGTEARLELARVVATTTMANFTAATSSQWSSRGSGRWPSSPACPASIET